jgi:hypothetical protein
VKLSGGLDEWFCAGHLVLFAAEYACVFLLYSAEPILSRRIVTL